tara:strand:- start:79 stop:1683 length:1605 start_codon:yes stop_codon:yes gene_type:complete
MSIALRPYQEDAVAAARQTWKSTRSALVVLPTGTGKTITALSIVAKAREKGFRVLWLAHRQELLTQPAKAFGAVWPDLADDIGIVRATQNDFGAGIVFASIDTVRNPTRLAEVLSAGPPMLVVCDEAHHSMARSWQSVLTAIDEAAEKAPFRLGLTATPERTDSKHLGKMWDIAYSYSMMDAMDEGYLVPITPVTEYLEDLDLSEVAGTADYNAEELAKALLAASVVEHTVDAMNRHGSGRRALLFTASVEQARLTADGLNEAGWRAAFVSGETPTDERADALRRFEAGDINVICNCAVLTEGTDLPVADCIVVARPTRSKPLYIQMIGRGLRLSPGKDDCLVIDLSGATEEHNLIQAPVLLGLMRDEQEKRRKRNEDPLASSAGNPLKGMLKRRKPIKATWVAIRGLTRMVWVCDCGKEGMVAIVQAGDEWMPYYLPRRCRKPQPLSSTPVGLELAHGLGGDVVRRARSLTAPGARWRSAPATEGQLAYASRLGVALPADATKGQAAEIITKETASRVLLRLDLARPSQVSLL